MFLENSRARIEEAFAMLLRHQPGILEPIAEEISHCPEDTALAMKYLYTTMPCSDLGNYPFSVFLDYAAHSVMLWEKYEHVRKLPEEVFLNYVLYHRVNEEEIDTCRTLFYESLQAYGRDGWVTGEIRSEDWLTERPEEAIAWEVNFWCAREATYQASDDRTASARTVFASGHGRCGEESVFTVNAMRSVGIPARQVYAPKWSHCDDNHAWVEVWIEGEWKFLGACEPSPELNHGWFNGASSRAMMVHSRWFDAIPASAEKAVGKEGMVTMLNQLGRYAETVEAEVRVTNESGAAVKGAVVEFQVLNYAEFAPVAVMRTDEEGKVRMETGLGSLHVDVRKDGMRAEGLMDTRKERVCGVVLREAVSLAEAWTDFDMFAPEDHIRPGRKLTAEEQKQFDRKLAKVTGKRLQKARHFWNKEREDFFYGDIATVGLRAKLLKCLSEKDQIDLKAAVLEEHFHEASAYAGQFPEDLYLNYILNPRISNEVLTPWRKAISEAFSEEEKEAFRAEPEKIWDVVQKRVREHPDRERSSLFTTPAAALRLGVASEASKKVLFVAIARTLGIPSRLHPESGAMEYWRDGAFVPVLPEERADAGLILLEDGAKTVWKYFQNWTLARLRGGAYETLKLDGKIWEDGKLTLRLVPGTYRLLTANRLPNGNQFGKRLDFCVRAGETKEIRMAFRDAKLSDILSHIALPDFGLTDASGQVRKASELAEGGKTLFIWLEESKEPTEHILNELIERKEEFGIFENRIALIVQNRKALEDPTLVKCRKALPGVPVFFHDFGGEMEVLARRVYTEPGRLPLILVAERRESGVTALYGTSGYNVGTGDMVLRILNA
ncbi:MAG: transglutaminase-like domain-containing protein [Eubacteriales bacterium]|nr:transglutaminase-like domain-containing protein [Eubacteriales bacterium]